MTLDLNEKQQYKDFRTDETPRYVNQMPLLISGKDSNGNVVDVQRIPLAVRDIFERKLNSSKPDWVNNLFDTGDGIVVPARGAYLDRGFKIRKNSGSLTIVNPETRLIDGGIPQVSYETVSGLNSWSIR